MRRASRTLQLACIIAPSLVRRDSCLRVGCGCQARAAARPQDRYERPPHRLLVSAPATGSRTSRMQRQPPRSDRRPSLARLDPDETTTSAIGAASRRTGASPGNDHRQRAGTSMPATRWSSRNSRSSQDPPRGWPAPRQRAGRYCSRAGAPHTVLHLQARHAICEETTI